MESRSFVMWACWVKSVFSRSEENTEEEGEDKDKGEGEDRMDEDTMPSVQSDTNDLSAYNLDDYDNEAADTGMSFLCCL